MTLEQLEKLAKILQWATKWYPEASDARKLLDVVRIEISQKKRQ